MPDMIRATGRFRATGRGHSDRRGGFALRLAAAVALSMLDGMLATATRAQDTTSSIPGLAYVEAIWALDEHQLAGLALFFGVLFFAVVTAIMLVRTRERLRDERARSRAEVASLDGEIDRLYGLLLAEPQVIIAWNRGAAPEVIGDPSIVAPKVTRGRSISFGHISSPLSR